MAITLTPHSLIVVAPLPLVITVLHLLTVVMLIDMVINVSPLIAHLFSMIVPPVDLMHVVTLSFERHSSSDWNLSPYSSPFKPHIVTSHNRRSSSYPKYHLSSSRGLHMLPAHNGSLSTLLIVPLKEKSYKPLPKKSCGRNINQQGEY